MTAMEDDTYMFRYVDLIMLEVSCKADTHVLLVALDRAY